MEAKTSEDRLVLGYAGPTSMNETRGLWLVPAYALGILTTLVSIAVFGIADRYYNYTLPADPLLIIALRAVVPVLGVIMLPVLTLAAFLYWRERRLRNVQHAHFLKSFYFGFFPVLILGHGLVGAMALLVCISVISGLYLCRPDASQAPCPDVLKTYKRYMVALGIPLIFLSLLGYSSTFLSKKACEQNIGVRLAATGSPVAESRPSNSVLWFKMKSSSSGLPFLVNVEFSQYSGDSVLDNSHAVHQFFCLFGYVIDIDIF
jgi:hypothetical protein